MDELISVKVPRETHEAVRRIKRETGLSLPAIYGIAAGYWIASRSKKFAKNLACAASEAGK
jgi:hypothetical protein